MCHGCGGAECRRGGTECECGGTECERGGAVIAHAHKITYAFLDPALYIVTNFLRWELHNHTHFWTIPINYDVN
jgi:hypothetical protein